MEYSEKIAFLRRYREAVRQEDTLLQEIEALRCQAARVTQALTGMPGGGDGQAIPRAVEQILEAQEKLQAQAARTAESRTQVVSDISRMLKIMAKELDVPVICISQLSRANEGRQNKRPMLSDLRESGAIEQDADIVIGLYRDGYYNPEAENPNLAEAILLKNRHGQVGTVPLMWLPEYTTYSNAEQRYEE